MHYGDLSEAVRLETPVEKILSDIDVILSKYRV